MRFEVDSEFATHFRSLKQVFLYITDRCNLHCEQCIYKPNITFHDERAIPLQTALALITTFHSLGARKLTVLGGEPTLYGASEQHKPLLELLSGAKQRGYDYIRIDTNGQFGGGLLDHSAFRSLDEIAFSLDGYSASMNDPIRGRNTFDNCVANIRRAVSLGYKVTITCCVHRALVEPNGVGSFRLDDMIRFAEGLGIHGINFHDLFKAGVPMDTWTGHLDTTVTDYVAMYQRIRPRIEEGAYSIAVRLPQCFVTRTEFARNPEYYGYCPVKLGERVMVHPNGVIRICSNLICSAFGVARYYDNRIAWDRSQSNELLDHEIGRDTPCTNRSKNKSYGEYVPLCFSFKPKQDEYVWREMLTWDNRRTVEMNPGPPVETEAPGEMGLRLPVLSVVTGSSDPAEALHSAI